MITSQYLTTLIQDMLNAASTSLGKSIAFNLYDGFGKFERRIRNGNTVSQVIDGIVLTKVGEQEKINGIDMHSASCSVQLVVPATHDHDHSIDYAREVQSICDTASLTNNATTTRDEDLTYVISISMTASVLGNYVDGDSAAGYGTGAFISVLLPVAFGVFSGGINGSDIEITINGMTVPKNNYTKSRARTNDAAQYSGSRQTREIILGDGIGMDFSGPLTVDSFGKYLMSEADGDNEINLPLCVIETKRGANYTKTNAYLMIFGSCSYTGQPNLNGGYTASLVEGVTKVCFGANTPYDTTKWTKGVYSAVGIDEALIGGTTYQYSSSVAVGSGYVYFYGNDVKGVICDNRQGTATLTTVLPNVTSTTMFYRFKLPEA